MSSASAALELPSSGGGGGRPDRPPSPHTTTTAGGRPGSSRSMRSLRPSTPGGGSGGGSSGGSMGLLAADVVKVESRPVSQQGMVSVRAVVQGPGRQVMDKSYYLGRLRSKKAELQAELDVMSEEIERFQRCAPALAQVEQRRERLQEATRTLRTQLGDYKLAMEKVAAGMGPAEVDAAARALAARNEAAGKRIDEVVAECARLDAEVRDVEDNKVPLLEVGLEVALNQEGGKTRERFLHLRAAHAQLTAELQGAARSPEGGGLGSSSSSSTSTSREAVLARIRQDNAKIAQAESRCREAEAENQSLQEQVAEAAASLASLKGGKAEKFVEMQHKEEKMQEFIDNFEKLQFEQESMVGDAQQKIQLLLEHVAAETSLDGAGAAFTIYPGLELQHPGPRDLQSRLAEHKQELRQHEEAERNTDAQIADVRNSIHLLQRDVEKSAQAGLHNQQDVKSITLEVEKRTLEEQRRLVQLQIKEQAEKMNVMRQQLQESAQPHTDLEDLNKRIVLLEETNGRVKEEVEHKERQINYQPVIENLRFLVGRLNDALKMKL